MAASYACSAPAPRVAADTNRTINDEGPLEHHAPGAFGRFREPLMRNATMGHALQLASLGTNLHVRLHQELMREVTKR